MQAHVTLRPFDKGDIAFAVAQATREGWDTTPELFAACLTHDPDGCFIAEADGQRVAMITSTRYQRTGWIGNLIVLPEYRSRGIGRHLMTHAIERLSGGDVETLQLEADAAGIPLYRKLGFVDEFESLRFRRHGGARAAVRRAEHLTAVDLPAIAAFDAEHFGDDRARLLKLFWEQARAGYWISAGGRPRGYTMVVPSRFGARIGPLVATDNETADALLETTLADHGSTTLLVGMPAVNGTGAALFESHGFSRLLPCLRMIRGPRLAGARPASIFAIANGATG